jgi:uncharacterized protein YndB with AHSA1/START domain
MSLFLKILIALVVIVGILLGVIATRPDDFRVTRSATFNAPPATVFPQVNDFQKWEAWSPWAKLDPNVKNTFEGPTAGAGAVFRWVGNNEVGEGGMTILESRPNELVRIKLDFIKPFEGTSTAEFTFQPSGDQTTVTWAMFGKNNFIGKAFSLFVDCDKMMGGQFEKGLESMRAVAEAKPKP